MLVFADLLRTWNPTIRLVGDAELSLVERHIEDSLALRHFLSDEDKIADVGSGAGFPGLVLSIATGRAITLIESDTRKTAFLQEAIRATGAPARIHAGRVEAMNETFDLVMARAVAPLGRLLSLIAPILHPGSICLFPKGRSYEAELEEALRTWRFSTTLHPSATAPDSRILELRAIESRTDA